MSNKIPYTWQLQAAALGAAREIIALIVDCSCGKTLAGILIALKKQKPTIVIAPTHRLCDQWKEAIKEETGENADIWVYSKPEETAQGESYRERFIKWLTA